MVVATRDRPDLLVACIESLERQTLDRFRLVVVDDCSATPVADALRRGLGAQRSLLVLRNESPLGPGGSRNRGVGEATGTHVLFLDDDVRAHPGLLASHADVFEREPGAVVSIGALLPAAGGAAFHRGTCGRRIDWPVSTAGWPAARLSRPGHTSTPATSPYAEATSRLSASSTAPYPGTEDVELGYRLSDHGCRFAFEPAASSDRRPACSRGLVADSAGQRALRRSDRPPSSRIRAAALGTRGPRRATLGAPCRRGGATAPRRSTRR